MKCPYIINAEEKEVQTQDGIGDENKLKRIFQQINMHTDCLEQDCAAWQDGKCNYKG